MTERQQCHATKLSDINMLPNSTFSILYVWLSFLTFISVSSIWSFWLMYYSFTLIRSHSQDISFDHKSNEITYTYGKEKCISSLFLRPMLQMSLTSNEKIGQSTMLMTFITTWHLIFNPEIRKFMSKEKNLY